MSSLWYTPMHTHSYTHNKGIQSAGGRAEFYLNLYSEVKTVNRLHIPTAHLTKQKKQQQKTLDDFTSFSQISEHRHFHLLSSLFSPSWQAISPRQLQIWHPPPHNPRPSHIRFMSAELHSSFRRWMRTLLSATRTPNPNGSVTPREQNPH